MQKYLLGILNSLIFCGAVSAQCPERSALWKRIIFLRDSTHTPVKEQLAELLPYAGKMEGCPYKYDSTHALLLQRIGTLYYKQADYANAIQYTRRSITMVNAGSGRRDVNPNALIKSYYNLKIYYDSLHEIKKKMEAADSSIAVALRTKTINSFTFYNLIEKGNYLFDVGDYQQCSNYASYSEAMVREWLHGKDSIMYINNFFCLKINALLAVNDYDLSARLLSETLKEYLNSGFTEYLDVVYGQLAKVYIAKGEYTRALSFFQREFQYNKKAGFALGCKQNLNDIGYLYYDHLNDLPRALEYFHKALDYHNNIQTLITLDPFESLNIYHNIAEVYVKKREYDSAFYFFRQAFAQIRDGLDETGLLYDTPEEFLENKKIGYVTSLVSGKADAYLDRFRDKKEKGDLQEALHIYRIADQLLARIKAGQAELLSQLFWRASSRHLYEHAIEAAFLEGNTGTAFYFFEKSRAALLNDQLREEQWSGEGDILKQSQLESKILQLERDLRHTDATSTYYIQIQSELFTRKQELERLQQSIQSRDPLYYQGFRDSSFITLPDVQKLILADHQALLELFTGDSAVYALQVEPQHSSLAKLDKTDFDRTAGLYISYISDPALLNRDFEGYSNTARHLYHLIFQNGYLPDGRIIISEDGRYFPFEALVTDSHSSVGDSHSSAPVYFLADHAVSYTYSARYLLNPFISDSTAVSGNLIGIAPVQYGSETALGALPGSDHSLAQIASDFHYTDQLISVQASRENFLQQFSGYKIIQLYTHAADSGSNGEPVIYFADSALYLSDLIGEKKPATRLVVLSACETGNGRLYRGEGVFSFSRGFAALGVPSSIANLWDVDNESTYRLTELFYKNLSEGMQIDVALQKAKTEFMQSASKEGALPYYWAAAILVGKSDAIAFRKPYPWALLVLSVICIGGLSFWGRRAWIGRGNS